MIFNLYSDQKEYETDWNRVFIHDLLLTLLAPLENEFKNTKMTALVRKHKPAPKTLPDYRCDVQRL